MEESRVIELFGLHTSLNTLFSLVATVVIIWGICMYCTRRLSVDNPSKPQLALEWVIDFVRNIVGGNLHNANASMYQLLGVTLFLFVFISNILGLPFLLSIKEYSYWRSPTADPVVCLALAVLMILLSHFMGVQQQGFKEYVINGYLKPASVLFPIKIIEEFTNTLTLSLRLYGNIFAGEVLLNLIASLSGLAGPVSWGLALPLQMVWQGFSLFIGAIQAYLFVTLTMVYMSHKVEKEH